MTKFTKSLLVIFSCLAILISCNKPSQTVENLKIAAETEVLACAKYTAYAEKAKEEGFMSVAALFEAASVAEAIHCSNHIAALNQLNVDYDVNIPEFTVLTTLENLKDAQNCEEEEFDVMYPGFMDVAKKEKYDEAFNTFLWANYAEIKHAELFAEAVQILTETGTDKAFEESWKICPKCGDTYKTSIIKEKCDLCDCPADSFLTF